MIAINIREPWMSMILRGEKTIETRSHNRLAKFLGQRVALCRTPGGMIVGYATIRAVYGWKLKESFRRYYTQHRVPEGGEFDWKPEDTNKFGYLLEDVEACEPFKVEAFAECVAYKIIEK